VVSWLDTALWGLTVAAFTSAAASVTHERALKTHEPSCVPRTAKHFFVYVVHSPSEVVGHVAAPELPFQEGRVPSRGTRGSTGAHFSKKARSGAEGHVAAPELTSAKRRGPGPRDTWCRRSPPLQRCVTQSYSLRDSAWKHVKLLVST
jgi:hypothetical protein